ncbi:FAD-binding domain-containing protein [Massarina eburnea CBS 473.64]|uniref:FAD-binding domain-containing protein n=1 Tax=Massarina eburnea CBS 473.64 TaxID=1395130 RepID=A0A6A6S2Y5_9PLEO|nr:FAD-binding domain-containing protein [Massarina eburnea CBS 473.64]
MRATFVVLLSALLAGGLAQSDAEAFEPANFNVSAALLDIGVHVSAIPELAGLENRSSLSACEIACASLQTIDGLGEVLTQGLPAYVNFTGSYWSAFQGEVSPYCVFKPNTALEISVQILISRLTQCSFAVKGGGHGAFAGSSSIEGGITVSLENLDQISVSSDKTIASVGPGNRWINVYQALEKEGVAVVGGRVSTVGVPGLTLGGGISFFSNKYGWACDNVDSYEVVTASGTIINASAKSRPDLYWALRGGGGNFGVVTKFNFNAFAQGSMWGGARILSNDSFPAALDAIYSFATKGSSQDPDAAQIISFGYDASFGPLASVQLDYTKPVANASVFDEFNKITAVKSSTGIHTLSELTVMLNEGIADGVRDTYWDVTFKVDRDLFTFLVDTFYNLLPNIADAVGLLPTISIQAITVPQLTQMQRNGGNALGLDPTSGPLFIMNMGTNWDNPSDDARILKFHADVMNTVKVEAKKKGLDNDFIYMNYASQFQDPIGSYGTVNQEKLSAISKKYDPQQVFSKLNPGYFKLQGVPNATWPS